MTFASSGSKNKILRVGIPLLSFIFFGFGSCSKSLKTACTSQFPEFQAKLESASMAMSRKDSRGRALASIRSEELNLDEWKKWSTMRLNETQRFIDWANEDPRYRKVQAKLTVVANDLVMFYGYADAGKVTELRKTLSALQKHSEAARSLACDSQR